MSVDEFFGQVKSIFTRRAEERIKDYRSLVSAVASGKKPPAAARVVEILEEAGKSAENFETDVGTVKKREACRAELAELAALKDEVSELARKKTALAEVHKAESVEMGNRHTKEFNDAQNAWQASFAKMESISRRDPRQMLLSSSSEFDAVRAAADAVPDRDTDEALRKDRESAASAVSDVQGKLRELAGAKSGDILGGWASRDNSGPLKRQLAAAESRLAQIDEALARRAAEWQAYRDRCSSAELQAIAS